MTLEIRKKKMGGEEDKRKNVGVRIDRRHRQSGGKAEQGKGLVNFSMRG